MAIHMQQQQKTDMAHSHLFMLHLTHNKSLHHHPTLNPHLYYPFLHNTCHLELDLQCNANPPLNGFHYLLDFMDTTPHRVAAVLCGRGCGHGNRTCNNNYGRYWGALLKMLYTCQQHVDNRPKCCKILTTL